MGVCAWQCSCLIVNTCRPCDKMALLKLALFALLTAPVVLGARRLRGNEQRDQRSLTNTFPFNQKAGAEEHHEHHEHHDGHPEASQLAKMSEAQDAFIIFDEAYEGVDVDAFYLGDILRALGCNVTNAKVAELGGTDALGVARIAFA